MTYLEYNAGAKRRTTWDLVEFDHEPMFVQGIKVVEERFNSSVELWRKVNQELFRQPPGA